MTRFRMLAPLLLLAAGPGCFQPSPPAVYHTLQPLQDATPAPRSGLAVEVLPVRLPDLLQRPQLVMAEGPASAGLSATHRWGNPLDQDMRRVLVDNLALLLGSDAVVPSPYGDRVAAAYRVEVEVRSCAAWPSGTLTLDATWMVSRGAGPALLVRRTTLREPLPDSGPDALAAAYGRILGSLSRELAEVLLKRP